MIACKFKTKEAGSDLRPAGYRTVQSPHSRRFSMKKKKSAFMSEKWHCLF